MSDEANAMLPIPQWASQVVVDVELVKRALELLPVNFVLQLLEAIESKDGQAAVKTLEDVLTLASVLFPPLAVVRNDVAAAQALIAIIAALIKMMQGASPQELQIPQVTQDWENYLQSRFGTNGEGT